MPSTTEKPRGRAAPPQRLGDRLFSGAATGAGVFILVILAGVAMFLVTEAWPALWAPADEVGNGDGLIVYIWPLLFGTLLAAFLALLIAAPLAIAIALFITHYAPRRLAAMLGYLVDLLAAVPSIIYGLWGIAELAPLTVGPTEWLEEHLGFIPLFAGPASATGRTMLVVAIVLAVMILPICTAVIREAFLQTPRLHEEASLALGATRWEMIRMAVLPFARSGIISATMLGLGRALGETMAVAMVLSPGLMYSIFILQAGQQQNIAANIALKFPEASGIGVNVLIFTGLVLFVITLLVNMFARWIVSRRAEFSGAN